jgi:HK97 family phage prohead protease
MTRQKEILMENETRVIDLSNVPMELRADDDGNRTLTGYGAVFGKRSQDLGGFEEVIAPDAFNRTIKNQKDILVTLNHDVGSLLGRSAAGTARISVDEVGVRYEVDLPDTTTGRDVEVLAQRGDLFGSSFTFSVTPKGDSWSKDDDGTRVRTLNEVRLYELGPVVSPAYLDTTVALRSYEIQEAREIEEEDRETQAEPTLPIVDDVVEETQAKPTLLAPAYLLSMKR